MNVLHDFSNGLTLKMKAVQQSKISWTVWPFRWRHYRSQWLLEIFDCEDQGTTAVQDFLNWLTLKMKALQQSDTSCTVRLWRWRHYTSPMTSWTVWRWRRRHYTSPGVWQHSTIL